jgi:hypothetical protein
MADSAAFELVCRSLEESTSLDRLEARGTVRLALRTGGLDARSVTPDQMRVVVEKLLPAELASRGVEETDTLGRRLVAALAGIAESPAEKSSPEAVFQRLGGGL